MEFKIHSRSYTNATSIPTTKDIVVVAVMFALLFPLAILSSLIDISAKVIFTCGSFLISGDYNGQ